MNEPLPPTLALRWGNLRWVRQHGANEWSAECPKCGDGGHAGHDYPDRFRMFADGKPRGWCRKCGYSDFADSDKRVVITPEERQRWIDERRAIEQANLRKAQRALDLLRQEQSWVRYHECIGQVGMAYWQSKGVPDWAIEYFQLGWCYDKVFWASGQEFHTQTATIPVFAPGWQLVNIRHRLISPHDPGDKYRPDRAGLPASLYLTDPDNKPSGECILVEGEIKSIVVATRLDNPKLSIVGTPGKNLNSDRLDMLAECGRIWVVFDPDATKQAIDTARQIGSRARVVRLPVKPDDAFTMYGATAEQFMSALKFGRVVL